MLPYYSAYMEPGRAAASSPWWENIFKDWNNGISEEQAKGLMDNPLAQGYAAADTPFDFSSGKVGGRVPRPKPLQMRTSGSLFGGYNPYIQGRK